MAYIYKIINDINDKIYIGKTEFSIMKRFQEHCSDAFRSRNEKRPLYSAMRKYGIEHFQIELIEETDQPELREQYWIAQYNTYKNGYNATLGGDGKKYINYKEVIDLYQKEQNMVTVAKRMNISVDSVSNILHSANIEIKSCIDIAKDRGKITLMFSKDGIFLRRFNTTYEAAQYLIDNGESCCKLTTIRSHISEVCRGKRKTAAGYKWSFE